MKLRGSFIVLVLGLALLYPLQHWIDSESPPRAPGEETLYFVNGKTIKKMSLGLDGLVADIYWIRTIQYFGGKILDAGKRGDKEVRMDLLPQYLNIIVGIDPHHIPAYRFGAIFLADQDPNVAIDLLQRGIASNPHSWRLYQDLGYIYWHMGDFEDAKKVYDAGSQEPDAQWWMKDLAALMTIKGGSRETARRIYTAYLSSDDINIRSQAVFRLKVLKSFDELDLINALLTKYKSETGRCPSSLKVLAGVLESQGVPLNEELIPLDPDGFPFALDESKCVAALSPESKLPKSL